VKVRIPDNVNVPLVIGSGPLVRRVARDDPALLKDNLDDLVLVRGREDVLEFLLAGAAQDSLRALARVEDIERVDDFDEGDGAVCGTSEQRSETGGRAKWSRFGRNVEWLAP
jgi:hypothetical protein